MKPTEVDTSTIIEAPPQRVWHILLDLPAYPEWNQFLTIPEGKCQRGHTIKVRARLHRFFTLSFNAEIVEARAPRLLRWEGCLPFRRLFCGDHSFELRDLGDAEAEHTGEAERAGEAGTRTLLRQRERFTGLLSPVLGRWLARRSRPGFVAMNQALKARAEHAEREHVSIPPVERVLVIGGTGYVGSRLIPLLLDRGYAVRVLARSPEKIRQYGFADDIEVVEANVLDVDSLPPALNGIDLAYYLVHGMGSGGDFAQKDLHAGSNVGLVAGEQGVGRIIYLSGLGRGENLSEHLASRQEVGRVLGQHGVPVTEFRAAVVVGTNSVSFRMLRYLADRLPLMITPRWVHTRVQPIAEQDVLRYLVEAAETPESTGRILEVGGADVLTYGEMIKTYARIRGLRRVLIPVPVLTPSLSSYWVNLVTPIPSSIARPLIEGLKSEVVVHDYTASEMFSFRPVGYEEAVRRVLAEEQGA